MYHKQILKNRQLNLLRNKYKLDSLSYPCVTKRVCGKFPSVPPNVYAKFVLINKTRNRHIFCKSYNNCNIIMSVVQENPPMFMSCIQGSFSQNNPRFGDSVGKQCACNTLTSICWSVNRRIKIWKTSDLDFLLTKGDELFKVVNINRSLYFDELPKEFKLSGIDFKVEFSRVDNGFWRRIKLF